GENRSRPPDLARAAAARASNSIAAGDHLADAGHGGVGVAAAGRGVLDGVPAGEERDRVVGGAVGAEAEARTGAELLEAAEAQRPARAGARLSAADRHAPSHPDRPHVEVEHAVRVEAD